MDCVIRNGPSVVGVGGIPLYTDITPPCTVVAAGAWWGDGV